MKTLIKVMLSIAAVLATTFIAGRMLGLLTADSIRDMLEAASAMSPVTVLAIVVGLLFLDLFVAVPTLTVIMLGGYFLGFQWGLAAAIAGSALAAFGGYMICRHWGISALAKIVRNEQQRAEMREAFEAHGPGMIMLARAAPILPEVTACMAGITNMRLARFSLFWFIGTVPYVVIAAYAGSVSTIDNPMPAIYGALGLYVTMWTGWYFYRRRWLRRSASANA